MGFFKKIGRKAGGFFKKVASSNIGKTVLGTVATAVGGPLAGAAVLAATKLLGEKKTGEMTAKVVSDGTVKVDKVAATLGKMGIQADQGKVNEVVEALRYSAMGIGNKSISITKGNLIPPSDSNQGHDSTGNWFQKAKDFIALWWAKIKNFVSEKWKVILIVAAILAALVGGWYFLVKNRKGGRR